MNTQMKLKAPWSLPTAIFSVTRKTILEIVDLEAKLLKQGVFT